MSAHPRPLPLPAPPLAEEAAGIVLRPWRADDADAAVLAAAWADPDVAARTAVPADASVAAAARWIAGEAERRRRGLALDLVIARAPAPTPGAESVAQQRIPHPRSAGQVLGEVGLAQFDLGLRRAELGFWLAPEARGRGVATAAVRLLTAWALAPTAGPPGGGLGLRQVWARTTPGDRRAAGVLRRAGYDERGEAGGTTVWATPPAMLRA